MLEYLHDYRLNQSFERFPLFFNSPSQRTLPSMDLHLRDILDKMILKHAREGYSRVAKKQEKRQDCTYYWGLGAPGIIPGRGGIPI